MREKARRKLALEERAYAIVYVVVKKEVEIVEKW